jgi:hypothetical protein
MSKESSLRDKIDVLRKELYRMEENKTIEFSDYYKLIKVVDSLEVHLSPEERASQCQDCKRTDVIVEKTICPFMDEIHGKEVTVYLCESCYHERCMEI